MASLTCFNFSFTPSWRMFLLTIFFLSIFLRLGVWQLERAHEKQQIIVNFNQQTEQKPIIWDGQSKLPNQYQSLKISGKFLPTVLFLDNQHHNHQFGYDVLVPFLLTDGTIVIVDRGWVALENRDRSNLPSINIPNIERQLEGQAYYPSTKNWLLGEPLEKINSNTAIIELQDLPIISKFLHKSVYPFIIREDKNSVGGYVRDWSIVSMPPSRHYGYAVQWFAISLAVFIIFIALNIKKKL
ncbi:MAG: SURF1 family protein [Legionellaceae bacterium]|nr:SURF1 family protein [Legionellaceae bacterium]